MVLRPRRHAALKNSPGVKASYRKALVRGGNAVVLLLLAAYVGLALYGSLGGVDPVLQGAESARRLSSSNATAPSSSQSCKDTPQDQRQANGFTRTCIDLSNYPTPAIDPYVNGGVIVYLIGMVYTFMGLAVVCDEFFVPALEVFIDKFQISNDVAGATLMAAGGSAPELSTSIVGTFFSKSDVGFGTIVGSAVFNVLFVIGMCAIFSKELLSLTWWPLARDSSYYIFGLSMLTLFFGGPTAESQYKIYFWEALVLFLMYIGYVVLMKFNQDLNKKVQRWINKRRGGNSASGNGETSSDYISKEGEHGGSTDEKLPDNPLIRPTHFRVGLLQMVLQEVDPEEQVRIKVVAQIVGDVHETFRQIDADGNDCIDREEFKQLIHQMTGGSLSEEEEMKTTEKVFTSIDTDSNGEINFDEFKKWYLMSETRVLNEVRTAFKKIDVTQDNYIEEAHFKTVIDQLGMGEFVTPEMEAQAKALFSESEETKQGHISFDQFAAWYRSSMLFEKHQEKNEEQGTDEDEGLDISWPDTGRGRLTWIIWAPILVPLAFTIPDCRKPHLEKFFVATFALSIIWVAAYSYLMVWWATLVGDTFYIPDTVMGLTFLAAGTSIPDLLTSVIVARQGHGDMAVSSSIGSNIFDILVGLPIPWMLSTLVYGKPQEVKAQSLFVSVITLIGMLAAVIAIIAGSGWKMTKSLGFSMFVLYGIFVLFDLLRAYDVIKM